MSRLSKKLKNALLYSIMLLLGTPMFLIVGAEQRSFDTYFPTTPYKKVLDATHCVLGCLAEMSDEATLHEQKRLLHDLIIGRIVRLSFLLQALHNQCQQSTFDAQDKEYLIAKLITINTAYKLFMTQETASAYALFVSSTGEVL